MNIIRIKVMNTISGRHEYSVRLHSLESLLSRGQVFNYFLPKCVPQKLNYFLPKCVPQRLNYFLPKCVPQRLNYFLPKCYIDLSVAT